MAGVEIAGLIDRRVQTGESKQLVGAGKAMNVADLTENHPSIDVTDAGDGHNSGIEAEHDAGHFGFHVMDLPIEQLNLFNRLGYL